MVDPDGSAIRLTPRMPSDNYATDGGARVEALLANSQSGRTKFFEVGDAVEMSWAIDAGHYIEE